MQTGDPIGQQVVNARVTNPQLGDTLVWSGTEWINSSSTTPSNYATQQYNVDYMSTANPVSGSGTFQLPATNFATNYRNKGTGNIASTGTYTAPVTGTFYFVCNVVAVPSAGGNQITALQVGRTNSVGGTVWGILDTQNDLGSNWSSTAAGVLCLIQGDQVSFSITANGTQSSVLTHVSIILLHQASPSSNFAANSDVDLSVLNPNQSYPGNLTTLVPTVLNTSNYNNVVGANYNLSTGQYTVRSNGNYVFGGELQLATANNVLPIATKIDAYNTSGGQISASVPTQRSDVFTCTPCQAGDILELQTLLAATPRSGSLKIGWAKASDTSPFDMDYQSTANTIAAGFTQILPNSLVSNYRTLLPLLNIQASGSYIVTQPGWYLLCAYSDCIPTGLSSANAITSIQIWKTDSLGTNVVIAENGPFTQAFITNGDYYGNAVATTFAQAGDTFSMQINCKGTQASAINAFKVFMINPVFISPTTTLPGGSSSSGSIALPAGSYVFADITVNSSGIISAISTGNPMTTAGDTIVGGASGTPTRLAMGTANQILTVNAAGTALQWNTSGFYPNPMTTAGDTIVGGASGTPTRLAMGTANQLLTVNAAGTAEQWNTSGFYPNPMTTAGDIIIGGASGTPTRLGVGGQGSFPYVNGSATIQYSATPAAGVTALIYNSSGGAPVWLNAPRGGISVTFTNQTGDNNTYPSAGVALAYNYCNLNYAVIGLQFNFTAGSNLIMNVNVSGWSVNSQTAAGFGFAGIGHVAPTAGGNCIPIKASIGSNSNNLLIQTLGGTPLTNATAYTGFLSGCFD